MHQYHRTGSFGMLQAINVNLIVGLMCLTVTVRKLTNQEMCIRLVLDCSSRKAMLLNRKDGSSLDEREHRSRIFLLSLLLSMVMVMTFARRRVRDPSFFSACHSWLLMRPQLMPCGYNIFFWRKRVCCAGSCSHTISSTLDGVGITSMRVRSTCWT